MDIRDVADLLRLLEGIDPDTPIRISPTSTLPFDHTLPVAGIVRNATGAVILVPGPRRTRTVRKPDDAA